MIDLELFGGDHLRAIIGAPPDDRAVVSRWASYLGHPPVGNGSGPDYRHQFTRDELLRVVLAQQHDLELDLDFRAWFLEVLSSSPIHLEHATYLYVFPNDAIGSGPWLLTVVDTPEDLRDAILELGYTSSLYFDVARARAEIEELLPC